MVFTCTVQAGDADTDGISIPPDADTFTLDTDDSIRDTRTGGTDEDAVLLHAYPGLPAGHKVGPTITDYDASPLMCRTAAKPSLPSRPTAPPS